MKQCRLGWSTCTMNFVHFYPSCGSQCYSCGSWLLHTVLPTILYPSVTYLTCNHPVVHGVTYTPPTILWFTVLHTIPPSIMWFPVIHTVYLQPSCGCRFSIQYPQLFSGSQCYIQGTPKHPVVPGVNYLQPLILFPVLLTSNYPVVTGVTYLPTILRFLVLLYKVYMSPAILFPVFHTSNHQAVPSISYLQPFCGSRCYIPPTILWFPVFPLP